MIVRSGVSLFGPDGLVPVFASDALSLGGGGLLLLGAFGHCDTLDGPVIGLARKALETGNVNLVLPWVRAEDEPEIRSIARDIAASHGGTLRLENRTPHGLRATLELARRAQR